MSQASKHGIQSAFELRRNLCRANMDGPHKQRVGCTREADECHSHNDPDEPWEHPAGEREPIKGVHASSVGQGPARGWPSLVSSNTWLVHSE